MFAGAFGAGAALFWYRLISEKASPGPPFGPKADSATPEVPAKLLGANSEKTVFNLVESPEVVSSLIEVCLIQ